MKNILVATDFSNNAYNALFYTTQLFKERSCNFYLLNAFTELTQLRSQKIGVEGRRSLVDQLYDESVEGLNQISHRIKLDQENPNHQFKTVSRNKHLPEAIQECIDTYGIDLVVMGNRGQTPGKNVLWGSNVIKVMNELHHCPVLTVPREIEYEIPKEIAFATDYRHSYNAKVLQPLIQLASMCGSAVCIVHINEEERLTKIQKANLYTLREYLAGIKHTIHWMPDFSAKSKVLKTFVDELNIGMLSMIRYEHGIISNLLREPVIEKISLETDVPMMVIPYGAR